MNARIAFLFASGACALVYESMWLRELRVIFGASTLANAAVLAVFLGGLGLGGALLGRRAERSANPLLLYGNLELAVAVLAALSPFLVDAVRAGYLALGGSAALGAAATPVRLAFTALAIGAPATLMGGTFPAMARSLLSITHDGRRPLALLYGANTLGAVLGVAGSTFFALEVFGARNTLWLACAINALLGIAARSRANTPDVGAVDVTAPSSARGGTAPIAVLGASFASGFAFLCMELVWYRVGAPLLGGSAYSFALILALALAGVGAGSALYAFAGPTAPRRAMFALTCALEAALLLVPYALGDDLARVANALRDASGTFLGLVAGWSVVAAILVVPAALVAGFQFPLLLALAGPGEGGVARDSGDVYAANTAGSIAGSLFGGFGALPLLGALGAWKLAAFVLVVAGAALLFPARRRAPRSRLPERDVGASAPGAGVARTPAAARASVAVQGGPFAAFAVLVVVVVALSRAAGPSALWRHGGVGAGRGDARAFAAHGANERKAVVHDHARLLEEHEGVESSVAFSETDGYGLIVNGKSDGSTYGDRETQIGLALVPALLHGAPKTAFVIGLGTGQTAGWLGDVAGVERVDVVELEPTIAALARASAAANGDVMNNPRVDVVFGDGRERLATSSSKYDLVVSEPSNPYRAGVAGFYTTDFYAAAHARMNTGAVFAQWLQAYEIEAGALQMVLATLRSVFAHVDVYSLKRGDFVLIARDDRAPLDVDRAAALMEREPYRTAFARIFMRPGVAGLLASAVADDDIARSLGGLVNSDDRPLLELSFAQSAGTKQNDLDTELRAAAVARGHDLPPTSRPVDRALVETLRARATFGGDDVEAAFYARDFARAATLLDARAEPDVPVAAPVAPGAAVAPGTAVAASAPVAPVDDAGRMMRAAVRASARGVVDEAELAALSEHGFGADVGFIRVEAAIGRDDAHVPALLEAAFAHADAWISAPLLRDTFARLKNAQLAPDLSLAIAHVLATRALPAARAVLPRLELAEQLLAARGDLPMPPWCADAFRPLEPHPLWREPLLVARAACYATAGDAPTAAADDVTTFRAAESPSVDALLPR